MLDYYTEIEWYDVHLGRMLQALEDRGELDNTLIVVITSDNGMPFPRAKASLYDSGTRMPLAIRWTARVKGGRVVDDFVSHTDFAPTFLHAAGLTVPPEMTGRSLFDILMSSNSGRVNPERDKVVTAFERHTICRPGEAGYPMRAIRTLRWLYIRNDEPSRWPAGDPHEFKDCDNGPTKAWILKNQDNPETAMYFRRAFAIRPAEELYDVVRDPNQLCNLADDPAFAEDKRVLCRQLDRYLTKTKDPRLLGQSPGA